MRKMRERLTLLFVLGATIPMSLVFATDSASETARSGYEVLSLEELLANPEQYDSHQISVPGVLLWHGDEPVLFADRVALKHFNFSRSIGLEMQAKTDYGYLDRLPVIVSGKFGFDPNFNGIGYKGIFIVEGIVPNPAD
jgi:hypothetical protein